MDQQHSQTFKRESDLARKVCQKWLVCLSLGCVIDTCTSQIRTIETNLLLGCVIDTCTSHIRTIETNIYVII